jgi:hypothetical protein
MCHDLSLFDPDTMYDVDVTLYFGPSKYRVFKAGTAYIDTNGNALLGLKDALYCPKMDFTIVSKDRLLGSTALVVRDAHERSSPCAFFAAAPRGQLLFTAEPTGTGHWAFDLPSSLPPTLRLGDAPAFWEPSAAPVFAGAVAARVAAIERAQPAAAPAGADCSDAESEIPELADPSDDEDWSGGDDDGPDSSVGTAAPVAAQVTPPETAALWHRRLAHPGRDALANAVKAEAVTGIGLDAAQLGLPGDTVCEACIMGKSHQHPLPSASAPRDGPLDIVVSDLSGKLPPGRHGEQYAHLMVHLDSGYSLLGFVTRKSDVPSLVMEQLREVERQTGRPVKVFRSDRGGEYANYTLKDWLWANGIQHQMALPYLPQQKGAGVLRSQA